MTSILVVDDELSMREFLSILLAGEGHEVMTASSGQEAIEQLTQRPFDVVLTDLKMRKGSGLDVLHFTRKECPETEVIIMTAYASTETAITAMKDGACDYLTKPFKLDEVKLVVAKAAERAALIRENRVLKRQIANREGFEELVGASAPMRRVYDIIDRVAPTRATVLLCGESGTGKELAARAVHARSRRASAPFVAVNCGAIPADLIESELFGHVKGAFTGASRDKEGLFQAAADGTLFLDEVAELPLATQVKLLRALQERRVKPVGDVRETPVACRIVAASNKDLRQMVTDGTFREDLFYRLNVIQIDLPPLRERREDVPMLVDAFLARFCQDHDRDFAGVTKDTMAVLMSYHYPGNIRELENIIERLVTLETGDWISRSGLPVHMMQKESFNRLAEDLEIPEEGLELEAMVERLERNLLVKALKRTGGARKRAAKLLGISFRSLRYRLDKYRIDTDS